MHSRFVPFSAVKSFAVVFLCACWYLTPVYIAQARHISYDSPPVEFEAGGNIPFAQSPVETTAPIPEGGEATPAPTAASPANAGQSNLGLVDPFNLWGLPLMVGLAGLFGGLLYGIKDHRVELPHLKEQHTYRPGCLTDVLFGIGGGLIIYMIMPGSFNFQAGGFEMVKILGIAIVGGYGGRALVERVLASQLKQLEARVQEMDNQQQNDGVLLGLINRQLDSDDPDTPPVDEKELTAAILAASDSAREIAFSSARNYRKKVTANHEWEKLNRVVPVLEALAKSDSQELEARYHAQLGFTLKDLTLSSKMTKNDTAEAVKIDLYRRAKSELDKAIEIRNRLQKEEKWVYEFARAFVNIGLDATPDVIQKDLEAAAQDKMIRERIRKPDPILAKPLIDWLRKRHSGLKKWIEKMEIELP